MRPPFDRRIIALENSLIQRNIRSMLEFGLQIYVIFLLKNKHPYFVRTNFLAIKDLLVPKVQK